MSESRNNGPVAPERATASSPISTPPPAAQAQHAPPPGSTAHPMAAPYPTYTYAQPPFAPHPRMIPFDKTWHWAKIALTIASLIFCLILLGISIAISIGPGYDSWNITAYWIAPFVVVTGLWNIAELITIGACGKRDGAEYRRGIHPGAHVGVDLLIWLAGIFCIFLSVLSYLSANDQLINCREEQANSSSSSSSSRYYYYCNEDEYALLSTGIYIPAIRAIMVFIGLLTLIHFTIFTRACIETDQRNRIQRDVVMMPSQMYYGPPDGMAPYGYPMMPPQAYIGGAAPQGGVLNEKSPATAQQPQANYSNLAGFYAPAGSSAAPVPQPQAPPRNAAPTSSAV